MFKQFTVTRLLVEMFGSLSNSRNCSTPALKLWVNNIVYEQIWAKIFHLSRSLYFEAKSIR